jgi:outer membrane receptor protein involved in Fe transport
MSKAMIKNVLLASTIFGGATIFTTPAFAQSAEPVEAQPDLPEEAPSADAGDIVVTGSRIARPNLEQSSPVSVISEEEISFAQPQTAEEFLRDLPGSTPGQNAQVNNGNIGIATLNLRNLGTNRNLVLLNERRVVPSTLAAQTDLNIIPVALLERVDIFTGGASTVYGADAVAGVVNFITKRNFAGVELNANYGISERGDGANYRIDLTTGANFADGRGNAVVNLSYTKARPVYAGEREFGLVARSSATGLPQGSTTAVPATINTPLFFNPTTGVSLGNSRINPATGLFELGESNYNFLPITIVQTPFERFGIFAQGNFEVSDAVEIYSQGFFTRTSVVQQNAPSGSFFTPFQVPLNNQFLSAGARQQICQARIDADPVLAGRQAPTAAQCAPIIASGQEVQLDVGRRFVEAGPRITDLRSTTFEIVVGARGPLTSTLNWDVSGQHGKADRVNITNGSGLASRLQESLRGCPAGSTTGCRAINLFGDVGTISAADVAFLDVPLFAFTNTELSAAQAVINGDLGFSSPLAEEPIGVAVGVEYRRYEGSSRGDLPSSTSGAVLGAGAPSLPIQGEYDTKEAFAELVLPIIENGFIHNLTLEAGFRYSDYSTSGGNETYKVGGSFMPIRDIKFRGVYSRAVRAPNLGELFQPQVTFLTGRGVDPCQGTEAEVAARGASVAVCRAAAPNFFGGITAPSAGQINATTGGNPDLDPEVATSITAGVVLQPTFLPGAALTLDYYDIKVRDAISNPTASDIIDTCYFGNTDPNTIQCQSIGRNPTNGSLSGPNNTTSGPFLGVSNLGRIRSSGWDLGISYRRDLGFARLNWSFIGNKTDRSLFQATPTSINRDCVGFFSPGCELPTPEYSWNMRTTLAFEGGSDLSLLWRHIDNVSVEPVAPTPQVTPGIPTNAGPSNFFADYRNIPAYDYFDLSFQQSIGEHMRFTLTIQNLLDKDPPFVGGQAGGAGASSTATNTFPSVYDPIGRRFTAGVNLRF